MLERRVHGQVAVGVVVTGVAAYLSVRYLVRYFQLPDAPSIRRLLPTDRKRKHPAIRLGLNGGHAGTGTRDRCLPLYGLM